ncbi:hypothetical protein [Streptomyces sp. NPDC059168]
MPGGELAGRQRAAGPGGGPGAVPHRVTLYDIDADRTLDRHIP